MPDSVYPRSVYDRPQNLLATLGTFWTDLYARKDQVSSYVRAKAAVEQQTTQDLLELLAAMSRYSVPIFHKDLWYELRLKSSERNDAQTSLLKYDAGSNYNDPHDYDVPVTSQYHAFPLPTGLADANLVMNRFLEPSLIWQKGFDFQLDPANDAIVFRTNPFDDTRVLQRPLYEDGTINDREAVLWIFRGDFDWATIYRQFGYVIGLRLQSSRGYRELLNAVFDAIVGGTSRRQIELAFSAMTGIPLVRETEETIQEIARDKDSRLIITNHHVYKFDLDALPTVEVGDVVQVGDPLVDSLRIYEFNDGDPGDLLALAMGPGFLPSCYYADLIFENKDVPLEVITDDPSGFVRLEFPLGGFPADVRQFFDDLHAKGVAAAEIPVADCAREDAILIPGDGCDSEDVYYRRGTLAHLLDTRSVRVGEPTAAALPRYINPLQFLVANVLRNNCFVVRVKAGHFTADGVGLHNARILRKIVPPHTAMLVLVELTAPGDSVTTDRITETLGTFDAAEPLRDEVPASRVREGKIALRLVSGTCQ